MTRETLRENVKTHETETKWHCQCEQSSVCRLIKKAYQDIELQ